MGISPTSSGQADLRVLVLHAYSPGNSGDGLLVELALQEIRAVVQDASIAVVAADAAAFSAVREDREGVSFIQWGAFPQFSGSVARRVSMLLTTVTGPSKRISELARSADLIVAVGGGYLRGGGALESLKSASAHLGQLRLAASNGGRAVYLSQSIGPFSGPYKRIIASQLSQLGAVFVRDDRTLREFENVSSLRRAPDMAVLQMASDGAGEGVVALTGRPVFVARPLMRPRSYTALLGEVRDSGRFDWAVQSTSGGNNDLPLIKTYGTPDPRPLRDYVTAPEPRLVVSTRLHGSMAALLAGRPSIHLSYERKGWGAFEDMGLSEYVLNARDTTLDEILALSLKIEADLPAYWAAVKQSYGRLRSARGEIRLALASATRGRTEVQG